MEWVNLFVGESQSRLYPHMRAKFGRGPTVVSKKARLTLIIWTGELSDATLYGLSLVSTYHS